MDAKVSGAERSSGHPVKLKSMTLDEMEREYVALRQQAEAVRSYL